LYPSVVRIRKTSAQLLVRTKSVTVEQDPSSMEQLEERRIPTHRIRSSTQ
jgi:hypothetical protein